MADILPIVSLVLLIAVAALQVALLRRKAAIDPDALKGNFDAVTAAQERTERAVREEIARNREESGEAAKNLRDEVGERVRGFNDSVLKLMADIAALQKNQLESFGVALAAMSESSGARLEAMRLTIEERLTRFTDESGKRSDAARAEAGVQSKQMRDDTSLSLKQFNDSVIKSVAEMARDQKERFESFKIDLAKLTESNEKKLAEMRTTVETKMTELQTQNAAKLDEMRQTVDEKLQGALDKRLGESFKLVSERLEQVHKGLGEMQTLANGVGDLKKVLINVKTRGNWGEMQLGNLLEQMLTPEQYSQNVKTKRDSDDRVEFAVRCPGQDGTEESVVWLPIDSKFPREDYDRLIDATERGNPEDIEDACRQLEKQMKVQAKLIRDKYIDPPFTTDFAFLFLPTEGLYGEVLRRCGLADTLQREYRVCVAGPTTLAALLNSLQMGFRTLTIQKRSSEVWSVLGAVKNEFAKFGEVIDKVKMKLKQATDTIDQVDVRTRAITRKLRDVEETPALGGDAQLLLGGAATDELTEAEA